MSDARPSAGQHLGAVVIGRNEGERLSRCLASVLQQVPLVAYADSGSTDGSVERAARLGVTTLPLARGPFTAALGRQAGLDALLAAHPDLRYVLFVDGDCLLQPGFVQAAAAFLDEHPRACAVAGRRREEGGNVWSRLIDIEWDVPAGAVDHLGGDSLFRVAALRECGGWPVELIAGEEPDTCFRCADRGWTCHRIAHEMTLHDIRMTGFGAYWKRSVRAGHAYIEVSMRRRRGHHGNWARRCASMALYAVVLPLAMLGLAFVQWPIALILSLLYVRLVWSLTRSTMSRGQPLGISLRFALLTVVGKLAGTLGMVRYLFGRATGKRTRLIEYRDGPAASGSAS